MANEDIKSLAKAVEKITELQKMMSDYDTQVKELQHRSLSFVDNPANPINREFTPTDNSVLYIPTLDKNRHFSMKYSDLSRYFDKFHIPLYFDNEEACSIFDSIFPILSDLIKFKVVFDSGTNMTPSPSNPVCGVYLDQTTESFQVKTNITNEAVPTIYFSSPEIARNCCIWLDYKYKLGAYKTSRK